MSNDRLIHISFRTALDMLTDLPERRQTARRVLAALKEDGKLSVFDATSSMKIARALDRLAKRGMYETSQRQFPWLGVRITPAGEAMLAESNEKRRAPC